MIILASVTFQDEQTRECNTETHLFATDPEYQTINEVLYQGVIQGDWNVISRNNGSAVVIDAQIQAAY